MFDIGWSEMLLLGMIGLLVIGPRELPAMLRTIGRYLGRMRRMAHNFRRQIESVAEATDTGAELKDLVKDPALFDIDLEAPDLFEPVDEDDETGQKKNVGKT